MLSTPRHLRPPVPRTAEELYEAQPICDNCGKHAATIDEWGTELGATHGKDWWCEDCEELHKGDEVMKDKNGKEIGHLDMIKIDARYRKNQYAMARLKDGEWFAQYIYHDDKTVPLSDLDMSKVEVM